MTQTLRKFQQNSNTSPKSAITPQGLAIHRDSRVISKVQPKIRIIHIFAPEIIHTDVAHFPETVQRLTGKSSSSSTSTAPKTYSGSVLGKNINANSNPRANKLPIESYNKKDHDHGHGHHGSYGHDHGHHHGTYDHGGFLEDLQGVNLGSFMHEIGEFPFVSMEANHHHHHHLNGFGETHHSLSYRG